MYSLCCMPQNIWYLIFNSSVSIPVSVAVLIFSSIFIRQGNSTYKLLTKNSKIKKSW